MGFEDLEEVKQENDEEKENIGFSFDNYASDAMMISSVEATEWVEVTRFTGSGTTDYFTCEHVEWRIRWEYTPSKFAVFSVFIYEKGEDGL